MAEAAVHAAIRHAVFVEEQGLFDGTDRDGFDTDPTTEHVLGFVDWRTGRDGAPVPPALR